MVLDGENLKKIRETLNQHQDKQRGNKEEFSRNIKEATAAQKEKEANLDKAISKKKQSKGCSIL